MKPSLLDRISWPTMNERCRLICVELGESHLGDYMFERGDSIIYQSSWLGSIRIGVKGNVIYNDGWIPGIKKECKWKIKRTINNHFAMALDARRSQAEQKRERDNRKAEELNQVCNEWNDDHV